MDELQNILSRLVQTGTVTAVDSAKRRARVKFKDTGIISDWLYVLQHYGANFYIKPDAKHILREGIFARVVPHDL